MALLGASANPMPGDMEYYVLKHGEEMFGGIMQGINPTWEELRPAVDDLLHGGQRRRGAGGNHRERRQGAEQHQFTRHLAAWPP